MSALDAAIKDFKARLLKRERTAADTLTLHYGLAYQRIYADMIRLLNALSDQAKAGNVPTRGQLLRSRRLALLLSQIEAELGTFSEVAESHITAQQAQAVQQAIIDTHRMMSLAVDAKAPQTRLAEAAGTQIKSSFAGLPNKAAVQIIGALGNGSPLSALLSQIAPQAAKEGKQVLVDGVITGRSPRETAGKFRQVMGAGLNRALTISRTETLRAYRNASQEIYKKNDDVVSHWMWVATHDSRTCAACLAMDGRVFDLSTPFGSHPNCRCVQSPLTKTFAEMGLQGIEEPRQENRETGSEWFARQPEDVQRQVLGTAKYGAYASGQIALADLVQYHNDPNWGPTRTEANLQIALANSGNAPQPASQTPVSPPVPAQPPLPPGPVSLLPENLQWQSDVRQRQMPMMDRYAASQAMATGDYLQEADDHLKELFKGINPWLRIRPDRLEQVLTVGEFKNRFETNTSGGTLSLSARQKTEEAHFGIDVSAGANERPIYGYLHLGGSRATGPDADEVEMYGSAAVRFKPAILARTTFTVGDSMDETRAGREPNVAAVPVRKPAWIAAIGTGDVLRYKTTSAFLKSVNAHGTYVEAQYHGGVSVSDIAEVVLTETPTPSLRRTLRASGIQYRVSKSP